MSNIIKNNQNLAKGQNRKDILSIIETGLHSIQPGEVLEKNVSFKNNILSIKNKKYDISQYNRIYILGIGKGSADIAEILNNRLNGLVTSGDVIDLTFKKIKNIKVTKGEHPLPTQTNLNFTKEVIEKYSKLKETDLVITVICGGGSALFEYPNKISSNLLIDISKVMLTSGVPIEQMNTVRKHLSKVKGGQLAELIYPAKIISLIFSDIPGNDLSFIASGPTVKDNTTISDAISIINRFHIQSKLNIDLSFFEETPKDKKYFENVSNILMLSNKTALNAMEREAIHLGYKCNILSDRIQMEARELAEYLIKKTDNNMVLLGGGESVVTVHGNGKGGRNQEASLASYKYVDSNTIFISIGTDGWDNSDFAGGIMDDITIKKANKLGLLFDNYINNDDSYNFFKKTGDAIITGKLPSNVSDLMIVLKRR